MFKIQFGLESHIEIKELYEVGNQVEFCHSFVCLLSSECTPVN